MPRNVPQLETLMLLCRIVAHFRIKWKEILSHLSAIVRDKFREYIAHIGFFISRAEIPIFHSYGLQYLQYIKYKLYAERLHGVALFQQSVLLDRLIHPHNKYD